MPRPKKQPETEQFETSKKVKKHKYKFGDDLPKRVEITDCKELEDYKYKKLGTYWKDKVEIICVMLLEKHT